MSAIILHSCRESETEESFEMTTKNLINSKVEMSKNSDTIRINISENEPETDEKEDPPIRHGGQWKNSK